jgi:hypothetical protein
MGTPFQANSNTPGESGGVSCQKLVAAIYKDVGFADVQAPDAPMSHAKFSNESLLEPFMDARPEFARMPLHTALQDGDMLGFRLGKIIHHSGILMWPHGGFIHVIYGSKVQLSYITDATWLSRLAAIWRPIYS